MKRTDLMRRIARLAKLAKAQDDKTVFTIREGGSHTVVTIGDRSTAVPRHNEIKEPLAKEILKDLGE